MTAIAAGVIQETHEEPRGPLAPEISGRLKSYYEWDGAGIWRPAGAGGAMHGGRKIKAIRYGFDDTTLYVRVDVHEAPAGAQLAVEFVAPPGVRVEVEQGGTAPSSGPEGAQAAWQTLVEVAIPLAHLGGAPGGRLEFLVLLRESGHVVECAPEGRPLAIEIPGPDFEARHWSA
jgi:hypothetical protein